MKKLCLVALVALFSLSSYGQETTFGATAGYLSGSIKAKSDGQSVSSSESGFYVGAFAEISISDVFSVQPELLYANIKDSGFIQIPIMAKYYVAEQFSLQAGPQVNISLEETGDDFSAIGIALGIGAGYDITEDFLVSARYALQINNSYTGPGSSDLSLKTNFLNVGIGYRF